MADSRSTKRQKELLDYVDAFIKEHGYGPSYREIMNGIGYKSVSTVAIHIEGLIAKGYLNKRDHSARSLEVISSDYKPGVGPTESKMGVARKDASKEKWLVEVVESHFAQYSRQPSQQKLDELYVLVGSLKVIGFDAAYEAMRLKLVKAMQQK